MNPKFFHIHLWMKSGLLALTLSAILFASACAPGNTVAVETPTPAALEAKPPAQPESTQALASTEASKPTAKPAVKGFVMYDPQKQFFHGYTPDGKETFLATANVTYLSPSRVSVADGVVYYLDDERAHIVRSDPQGPLPVEIPGGSFYGLAVSPDESRIAWSTFDVSQTGKLYIADLDSSHLKLNGEPKEVASSTTDKPIGNPLIPIEWTADGQLLYERSGSGFGGYIPYSGHSSLFRYNPADGQTEVIVAPSSTPNLCLDTYRLDLQKVVFICDMRTPEKQGPGIVIRDLKDGSEKSEPKFASQGLAGSARFSPSGQWLAYAIAAGNPDNESGEVIIVPADSSALPVSIAKVTGSFPYVDGWLDEDTLLVSQNGASGSIAWTIRRDGTGQKEIAQGQFVGWIR